MSEKSKPVVLVKLEDIYIHKTNFHLAIANKDKTKVKYVNGYPGYEDDNITPTFSVEKISDVDPLNENYASLTIVLSGEEKINLPESILTNLRQYFNIKRPIGYDKDINQYIVSRYSKNNSFSLETIKEIDNDLQATEEYFQF